MHERSISIACLAHYLAGAAGKFYDIALAEFEQNDHDHVP
jgi:hypothetical protein